MKLIIATNNNHKLTELKYILTPYFDEILSLNDAGIIHETVEDGITFESNAYKKASEIAKLSGLATLADDSGLLVDALDGAPGVFSARYAGENATDKQNVELLLHNLKNVPQMQRTARFVCSIALILPKKVLITKGEIDGLITDEPKGNNGFGYDPIFYVPEYNCTFAELDCVIKNKISHRAKAINSLIADLNRLDDLDMIE